MEVVLKENRPGWVIPAMAAVLAGVGILSLPHIVIPPGKAQAILLYHGWGLAEGLVPYRDMWGNHSPGLYFLYALAVRLSGHRYVGINILEMGWRLLTVVAVYRLAAYLYGRREGIVAAVFYGAWAVIFCGDFGQTGHPESFVVLPLVLAALYYMRDTMVYHVLCGLMSSLAAALDADALIIFAVILVFIIATPRSTWEPKPKMSKLLGFFHGVVALAVPLVFFFVLSRAADDFWRQAVSFNIYSSNGGFSLGGFSDKFMRLYFFFIPFWALLWARGGLSAAGGRNRLFFMSVMLGAAVVIAAVKGGTARHHFFVISGFAAVLASGGAGVIIDFVGSRSGKVLKSLAAIVTAAWIIGATVNLFSSFYWHPVRHYRTLDFLTGQITKSEYFGRFIDPGGDTNMVENRMVAAYARKNLKPSEKLLVWGNEALVNFWALRFAPTRFFYNYPLISSGKGCRRTEALKEQWRREFMGKIVEAPPEMVVVVHRDEAPVEGMDSAALLAAFPEFGKFIGESYGRIAWIGDFEIYRLR